MLLNLGRLLGVGIAGLALAGMAHAEEANVKTSAASAKLGGEFRGELIYDNHGFEKAEGVDPKSTSMFQVSAVNLKLDGELNKETEYAFRFNMLVPSDPAMAAKYNVLDYGYATHWFTKMIGFSIGKMRVMQGGWDHMESNYRTMAEGVFADNLVYNDFDNAAAVHLKVAGEVTLQLLNDVVVGSKAESYTGASYNKNEHPTFVLGWMGAFGPIHPLVDFGSYDNNKSHWIDAGVKTKMNGLEASLDFYNNSMMHKAADSSGKMTDKTDTATAISLHAQYEVKNMMTPWLYFSTYDNKQADTDLKYNATGTDGSMGWADNGVVWGIGANLDNMGKGYTPFIAIVNQSGKFLKAGTTDTAEDKSNMWIKLGVLGEI